MLRRFQIDAAQVDEMAINDFMVQVKGQTVTQFGLANLPNVS